MAINAPIKQSDFTGFLNPEIAAAIFDDAQRQSAAQQLFQRVPLGANGQAIPYVSTKPVAKWTSEATEKGKTQGKLSLKNILPKKLTAIAVMSSEVLRANPGNYSAVLRRELAGAFATAFDLAVFHDLGGDGTGTGPFDASLDETTKAVEIGTTTQANGGIHGDLVAGLSLLVNDSKKLTGFALGDVMEPLLYGAVDTSGRPLYVELPTDTAVGPTRPGRLLNRPSWMGEGVAEGDVVGFGGNFAKGAWGAVGGISYRVSTEATVTINGSLVSLWENNLVAVLAEAEYGFVVEDVEHFVKFTVTESGS